MELELSGCITYASGYSHLKLEPSGCNEVATYIAYSDHAYHGTQVQL